MGDLEPRYAQANDFAKVLDASMTDPYATIELLHDNLSIDMAAYLGARSVGEIRYRKLTVTDWNTLVTFTELVSFVCRYTDQSVPEIGTWLKTPNEKMPDNVKPVELLFDNVGSDGISPTAVKEVLKAGSGPIMSPHSSLEAGIRRMTYQPKHTAAAD